MLHSVSSMGWIWPCWKLPCVALLGRLQCHRHWHVSWKSLERNHGDTWNKSKQWCQPVCSRFLTRETLSANQSHSISVPAAVLDGLLPAWTWQQMSGPSTLRSSRRSCLLRLHTNIIIKVRQSAFASFTGIHSCQSVGVTVSPSRSCQLGIFGTMCAGHLRQCKLGHPGFSGTSTMYLMHWGTPGTISVSGVRYWQKRKPLQCLAMATFSRSKFNSLRQGQCQKLLAVLFASKWGQAACVSWLTYWTDLLSVD